MHSLKSRTHQRSARWHRVKKRHCIESAVANAARRCTIHSAGITDTTGHAWDNANQLTGITFKLPGQPDRITSYTHDAAGQMTAKTLLGANGNPGIKAAYSFDAAGRLTQIEWRNPPYALADQIDAVSYTYDANGNRLTKTFSGTGPCSHPPYDGCIASDCVGSIDANWPMHRVQSEVA